MIDRELLKTLVSMDGLEIEEMDNEIFFYRSQQNGRVYDPMSVPNDEEGVQAAVDTFTARALEER